MKTLIPTAHSFLSIAPLNRYLAAPVTFFYLEITLFEIVSNHSCLLMMFTNVGHITLNDEFKLNSKTFGQRLCHTDQGRVMETDRETCLEALVRSKCVLNIPLLLNWQKFIYFPPLAHISTCMFKVFIGKQQCGICLSVCVCVHFYVCVCVAVCLCSSVFV